MGTNVDLLILKRSKSMKHIIALVCATLLFVSCSKTVNFYFTNLTDYPVTLVSEERSLVLEPHATAWFGMQLGTNYDFVVRHGTNRWHYKIAGKPIPENWTGYTNNFRQIYLVIRPDGNILLSKPGLQFEGGSTAESLLRPQPDGFPLVPIVPE